MKKIKRMLQLNLKTREIFLAKRFAAAFVIPIFVLQMTLPNILLADIAAVVDDPVAEIAEEVEEEPAVEEAPVAEEDLSVEPEVEEPAAEESEADLDSDAAPGLEDVVDEPDTEKSVAPVSENFVVAAEEEAVLEQPAIESAVPATQNVGPEAPGNGAVADVPNVSAQSITMLAVNPNVTSTTPSNGATGVSIAVSSLEVFFNTSVDCGTVNSSTFLLKDSSNQQLFPMGVHCGGANATFTLSGNLANNTTYTATIKGGASGVKSATGGLQMLSDYSWSFSTIALSDTVAPSVVSTDPVGGSTNVPLETIIIKATFSEPVRESSITYENFYVKDNLNNLVPAMSIVLINAGTTAQLSLASYLVNNKTYTATVVGGAGGVKDLAGNALATDHSWSFSSVPLVDAVAPTVVTTDPSNNSIDVPLNTTSIQIDFSEPVQRFSYGNFSIKDNLNSDIIPGGLLFSNNDATVSINLVANLENNKTYTVRLTGIQDLAGNALAADHVWSFSTPVINDSVAPTVLSASPTGVNVPLTSTVIQVNFSEPILASSAAYANFSIQDNLGTELLPMGIGLANNDTALSLQLADILELNKTYNVTVTTGIKDLAGNPMAANYVWSFSTNPTGAICQTTADTSGDGIISNLEILSYINAWKSGSVSNLFILQAVQFWKVGSGC